MAFAMAAGAGLSPLCDDAPVTGRFGPPGWPAPAGSGPRISRAPGQGRWPLPSGARRAWVQVFPALRSARPCGGTFGSLPEAGMPTLPGRLPRHPARRRWLPL